MLLVVEVVRLATRGLALWKFRNLRTCPHSLQTPLLLAPFEFWITQWWAHLALLATNDSSPLHGHNLPHLKEKVKGVHLRNNPTQSGKDSFLGMECRKMAPVVAGKERREAGHR